MDAEVYEASDSTGDVQSTIIDADGLHRIGNPGGRASGVLIPILTAEGSPVVTATGEPVSFTLFLTDDSDTTIDRVTFEPGGVVSIEGFGASESAVVSARAPAIIAALEASAYITTEQAGVAKAAIEAGATLGEALIAALGVIP
jgi:hypothetical protein